MENGEWFGRRENVVSRNPSSDPVVVSIREIGLMPFTPLHFGPGAAMKAAMPAFFSFTVFVFSQIVMDLEPTYYLVRGDWPVHRFLHTYLGAALVSGFSILAGKPLCEWTRRLWNRRLSPNQGRWLAVRPTIPWRSAVMGGVLGAYSHVGLDSIMHADMAPLAPWTQANPWLHAITLATLEMSCVLAGVLGLLVLGGYALAGK
jgi:hypothetical protein